MCNECKIGRAMARKGRSKSVAITTEDVVFGIIAGGAALAANKGLNVILEKQPDSTRTMIGQVLPFLKAAGGAAVAMNKKMDRRVRFGALGVAFAGGIETIARFAPEYVKVGSGSADIFSLIQGTDVTQIPVNPNSQLAPGAQPMFKESQVLGTSPAQQMLVL